jgi:hypothetical protein
MATLARRKASGRRLGRTPHDGAGGPSLSSSGGSPAVAKDRMTDLVLAVEQPFTVGTLVRAAERDGVAISHVLQWLRDAERSGAVRDTGARRGSRTALRGSRLYRSAP